MWMRERPKTTWIIKDDFIEEAGLELAFEI